ncbi:MAG TPA: hypothetical protein VKU80_03055 [Planctomycetota bacterium]|nr:hypothetical protein [Planctomycetota bacterium]
MVLPLLGGCIVNQVTSFGIMAERTSNWYETGAVQKPLPEISRTVHEAILRQGYVTPNFDDHSGYIVTGWNTTMSPMFRESVRSMIEVQIVPVDPNSYNVRIRSSVEVNDSSSHPGDAELASWVGAGVCDKQKPRIPEAAIQLHTMLKLRFFGFNQ